MEIIKWNEEFLKEFKSWNKQEQSLALFIEEHPSYPSYLLVNSFDPLYAHTLKDVIGEYRSVHKLDLQDLLDAAEESGYRSLIYTKDPKELFSFVEHLDDPYPFDLNFEFKKFQLRGFNYTKDLRSCIINWSTGTGKSLITVARIKYLLKRNAIDKVVILSKAHNKTNWKRTLLEKGDLEGYVDDDVEGSNPQTRREHRDELYRNSQIFIINYEKMRFRPEKEKVSYDESGKKRPAASGDGQELLAAIKGQRVLWVWDEMPNKMKSMNTGWYKGAQKLLRATSENYQMELTAKKLDRDPENIYSCTKILDPTIWTSVASFRSQYAKRMSSWSKYQVAVWDNAKLAELGMRLSHMTHVADKYTDPEIQAEFPEEHWEDIFIDMIKSDRVIYDAVRTETAARDLTINSLIPLQLVCNNPLLLEQSESEIAQAIATKYKLTDNGAKLETLKELLDDIDGKVVIFTMFNKFGIHMLAPYLAKWGHTFVVYDGNRAQMQEAQDKFRNNDKIKVFLSSDQGSDSIDLEQANTVINYDLPWNHSTLVQRVNRVHRITSTMSHTFYYNLIVANSIEERKLKLLERKRQYEEAIDNGISADLISFERSDLEWLLG